MTAIGWSSPRTPTGRSSLVCPPPWHVSGALISTEFTVDPDRAAGFFPPGVQPDPDGGAAVVFGDWSASADNDPILTADPARGQYREAFLVLYGQFRDRAIGFVPFIWVDSDLSLVRGLLQGFPKQYGDVAMTRAVEVGPGGVRRQPGSHFAAHVSQYGRRLCEIGVRLEREATGALPRAVSTPILLNKVLPALDGTPGTDLLVFNRVGNVEVGPIFRGRATVDFAASDLHEIGTLLPPTGLRATEGSVFSFGFSILGSKAVHDYNATNTTLEQSPFVRSEP